MFPEKIQEKLEKYSANVTKWNEVYNLLSSSQNKDQIWSRHVIDSTQIHQFIPAAADMIVDLGSGAGFPAIPCAIISEEKRSPHKYILVESVGKKTNFLEDTIRITGLKNVKVRNERVENIKDTKADVITARAFSKIPDIFKITKNIRKPDTLFILHKGKNIEQEIKQANIRFSFEYQLVNGISGEGFIFLAKNVKEK